MESNILGYDTPSEEYSEGKNVGVRERVQWRLGRGGRIS